MLVITVVVGQSLRIIKRNHSSLSRLSLPTNKKERAAEGRDEDNRDDNPGYSSNTNTVMAIAGSLEYSSTT